MSIFLANALLEGGVGVLSLASKVNPALPQLWTPGGTNEGRYGMLAEVLSFALVSFGAVPSFLVWLTGARRENALPVAVSAALYHTLVTVSTLRRRFAGKELIAPETPVLKKLVPPAVAAAIIPKDPEQAQTSTAVSMAVSHGLMALAFVRWLLTAGRAASS
ncbi:hypothetical protein HK105_208216 [Polyrhizophydium stewartii]|uniref:DUF1772 domain-containing protein n=1 Tax=Polyrhizophydium stewartii TaxID=2732419 RepID=A0ABR4MYN7_9FUNG|nr:hypothetical protein HK105_004535 [Polyrhizophydium stewartii]